MMEEDESIKWINQESRRKAVQRAKDKASAAKWNLDVAIFSFGVLATVSILSFERVGIWITASVAISGLVIVWLLGWRRARQLYAGFLNEELAQCPDEWKDYYQILRISPSAEFTAITEAYQRLSQIFRKELTGEEIHSPLYSQMLVEVNEAYKVLSDPINRTPYDRAFWLRYNATNLGIEESAKYELVDISLSIPGKLSETIRGVTLKIPLVNRTTRPMVIAVLVILLSVLLGGTSFAFAKPGHPMAAPFRGVAITLTEASSGSVALIEDVRGIVATHERSVVSTALQSMRLEEDLKEVPAGTVSTNDMAVFPSPEHPLFPDYLDRKFSQFKYTVDSKGIISVDTSGPITDAILYKIERTLDRLEKSE